MISAFLLVLLFWHSDCSTYSAMWDLKEGKWQVPMKKAALPDDWGILFMDDEEAVKKVNWSNHSHKG